MALVELLSVADIPARCDIDWPVQIYERRGAAHNLCGIKVFHDFPWLNLFPDERTQFRNGRSLAQLALGRCPPGTEPALLLTQSAAPEGRLNHSDYYLTVINLDRYRATAGSNAAAGYFAEVSAIDPITAARLDEIPTITQDQRDLIAMTAMTPELVQAWLRADQTRITLLTAIIQEFDQGGDLLDATRAQPTEEAVVDIIALLGGRTAAVEALLVAGADLSVTTAESRILQARRDACGTFREQMEAGEWRELEWQRFLEEQTWIFGYGLRYQFLETVASRPYVGGRNFARTGGQESDFLLTTSANVRFTVLVEIKRPETPLLAGLYRNQTYPPSHEMAEAVAQVQQERARWALDSATRENIDALEQQGIFTHEPRGILVIGNTNQLIGDDGRARRNSFESYRRNLVEPEILTFDELMYRAQEIVRIDEATPDAGESTAQDGEFTNAVMH